MTPEQMISFLQSIATMAVSAQRLVEESTHLGNPDVVKEVADSLRKADDAVGWVRDVLHGGLEDTV